MSNSTISVCARRIYDAYSIYLEHPDINEENADKYRVRFVIGIERELVCYAPASSTSAHLLPE